MTTHRGTFRPVAHDPADEFSAEELDRSRSYQRPLARVRLVRTLASTAALLLVGLGELPRHAAEWMGVDHWMWRVFVVMAVIEVVSLLTNIPLDVIVDRHDKRWGVSTQTVAGFVTDQTKSIVLGLVLNTAVLIGIYAVIRSVDSWWIVGAVAVSLLSVALGFLFPVVIAPIFNRFEPLDDDQLTARIDHIADRAGVDLDGALVADESRRSTRDNAYVSGLGKTRRMVLYDTILDHPTEIVEQVVAHEVGHWRLGHLRRQLPLAVAVIFVTFAAIRILSTWSWIYDATGATNVGDPYALPLLALLVVPITTLGAYVTAWVSRAFERQADLEALDLLERPDLMLDMQRRLHLKNLADLDPSWLRRIGASHPPAAERMALTRRWAKQMGVQDLV